MTADDRAARRTLDAYAASVPEVASTAHRLTLLSRAYCGLCDDMREAAARVTGRHGWTLEDIDVDADPVLEARWGDLVPVLFLGPPDAANELCHYHFDAARVDAAFAANERGAGDACASADRGRAGS